MSYARRICDGPLGAFPIEVYEHIMDYIHSDCVRQYGISYTRNALCSCALTCQAWLPRSRFLLYQSIRLYSYQDHDGNRDVILRLANTANSSTLLADLIRHLTISRAQSTVPNLASILPLLLVSGLPKLRTLTIEGSTVVTNPAFCHSIAKFSALTALSLVAVKFANVSAFRRLLAALQSLRDLKLEHVSWQTVGIWRQTAGQYTRQMPHVRKLSIVGLRATSLAAWAVLELLAPRIEQLVVSEWVAQLEFLTVDADKVARPVFERLVSLTVRDSPKAVVIALANFFSQSRADWLHAITLSLRTDPLQLIHEPGTLEQAVLGAVLPRLRSVTVVAELYGLDARQAEEQMLDVVERYRRQLGSLHRRGLLRVGGAGWLDDRTFETWVWMAPDEDTHTAPLCIRQYGVPLFEVIVNNFSKKLI